MVTGSEVPGLADGVGRWRDPALAHDGQDVIRRSLDEDVVLLPDPERTSFVADELSVADWRTLGVSHETKDIEFIDEAVVPGFVFSFPAPNWSPPVGRWSKRTQSPVVTLECPYPGR